MLLFGVYAVNHICVSSNSYDVAAVGASTYIAFPWGIIYLRHHFCFEFEKFCGGKTK